MAKLSEQLPAKEVDADQSKGAFLAHGVATGLVVGWLELAAMLAQRRLDPRISMDSLRTNLHFFWMVPLANVILFSVLGVILSLVARYQPERVRRFGWPILAGLGALAIGLAVEVLHPAAALVLACAGTVRLGPWIARRPAPSVLKLRIALGTMGVALAVTAPVGVWFVTSAEHRAIATLPEAAPTLPNVLWIVLDDVRADSMSLQGYARPTTPNLERLAKKGIYFNQARSTAPWTLPSHASMFTGDWPHELSTGWDRPLDDARPTVAESLAGMGYATAGFVANTYYGNVRYGLGRGFARYEDCYENRTISAFEVLRSAALGRRVIAALGYSIHFEEGGAAVRKSAEMLSRDILGWLDQRPRDRPFFVFANYFDAHVPFMPPEGSTTPRFGLGALPEERQLEILQRFKRFGANKLRPGDGNGVEIMNATTNLYRDTYESCVAYLDDQIGRFYDDLERRGLASNTLVVITSDHGEHFLEHGFFGHGVSLYRRELHVPLLIIPPSAAPAPARRVVGEMVSLRDLAATSVDLLGLSERAPFPGQSLAPLWSAEGARAKVSPALSEVAWQTGVRPTPTVPASITALTSVTAHGKELIRGGDGREELFDLATDPDEATNLSGQKDAGPWRKRLVHMLEGAPRGPEAPPPQIAGDFPQDAAPTRTR